MIVIPPSSEYDEYFTGMATNVWENALKDKSEMCDKLLSESITLVISCTVDFDGSQDVSFNLHFRYFKTLLYCFIEEH
jgi:hypothetical protein